MVAGGDKVVMFEENMFMGGKRKSLMSGVKVSILERATAIFLLWKEISICYL